MKNDQWPKPPIEAYLQLAGAVLDLLYVNDFKPGDDLGQKAHADAMIRLRELVGSPNSKRTWNGIHSGKGE
jgi:hypothetical protein